MNLPKVEFSSPAQISSLALELSVDATRPAAIKRIGAVYRKVDSQGRPFTMSMVAQELGVNVTTLERWVRRVPDLKKEIDAVRHERHPRRK